MIAVRAASRLHFGLLSPGDGEPWPDLDGRAALPARRFGGVGLMVEEPSVLMHIEPASFWTAAGPMDERALCFAHEFRNSTPGLAPHAILVDRVPAGHSGLGIGTQLGLAVAKALAVATGHPDWGVLELARRVGRGRRSAIGIHGFEHGGLIVEAGKRGVEPVAPLLAREELPEPWRVLVILPQCGPGLHGAAEQMVFTGMKLAPAVTEALCRLVLLGMLPAIREGDCRVFGEAVYDFNARVGELFAAAQGGRYAHPRCAEVIAFLRVNGVVGVGQSSWGPALFAIVEDADRAEHLAALVRDRYGDSVKTWVTRPAGPASVTTV
jgi:beta-RFAP synthase